MTFVEILRSERERRNLTQARAAEMLNITTSAYTNLEQGRWKPGPKLVKRLYQELGISPAVSRPDYYVWLLEESYDG
jgi:transcriptional regulator with XRE-family HTH domain